MLLKEEWEHYRKAGQPWKGKSHKDAPAVKSWVGHAAKLSVPFIVST